MRALLYALRQTPTIPYIHEERIENRRVHVDFLARVYQLEF